MFVSYEKILNEELRRNGLSVDDIIRDAADGQRDAPSPTKDGAVGALTGMSLDPIMIIPRVNVYPNDEEEICFYSFYHMASHERGGAVQRRGFAGFENAVLYCAFYCALYNKVGTYRVDPTNSYFPAEHCSFAVSKITVKKEELTESTWKLLQAFMRERQNLKQSIVYRLANIPAATFHRISRVQPKKETLLKIGVVLQLTLEEMTTFLESAGFAFNPSDKRDVLIKKCFKERVLNLQDITQRLNAEELDEMDFNLDLLDKLISDQLTSR